MSDQADGAAHKEHADDEHSGEHSEVDVLRSCSDAEAFSEAAELSADAKLVPAFEAPAVDSGSSTDVTEGLKKNSLPSVVAAGAASPPSPAPASGLLSRFTRPAITTLGEFLVQLTLGIRRSVELAAGGAGEAEATLQPASFTQHVTHSIVNPTRGDQGVEFKVLQYAPAVFRALRATNGWSEAAFIEEWTVDEEKLSAKEGAGRSGALFNFSKNRKMICKTIFGHEVTTLLGFLPEYLQYCKEQRSTLIMPILGLFKLTEGQAATGSDVVYALVFSNVMWSNPADEVTIDCVYDLKGRTVKTRKFHDETGQSDEGGVKKDKHLERLFYTGAFRERLIQQITRDAILLRGSTLIDYSLLVGVGHCPESGDCDHCPDLDEEGETSVFQRCHGGFYANGEIYYVGIIDCLTYFGAAKMVANSCKRFLWDQDELSTVQPEFYAHRFLTYMRSVFPRGDLPPVYPFLPNRAVSTRFLHDMDVVTDGYVRVLSETAMRAEQPVVEKVTADMCQETVTHDGFKFLRVESNVEFIYPVTEYAPRVFHALRQSIFGISDQALFESWVELSQQQVRATIESVVVGTMTSSLVPSRDRRFKMETLQLRELNTFLSFLPAYFAYLKEHKASLLQRIVGIFRFSIGKTDTYVAVYENQLHASPPVQMDECFHLFGCIPAAVDEVSAGGAPDEAKTLSPSSLVRADTKLTMESISRIAMEYKKKEQLSRLCGLPIQLSDVDLQRRRFELTGTHEDFATFQRAMAEDLHLLLDNNLTGYTFAFGLGMCDDEKDMPPPAHRTFKSTEFVGECRLPKRSIDGRGVVLDRRMEDMSRGISQKKEDSARTAFVITGGIGCLWRKLRKRDHVKSVTRSLLNVNQGVIVDPSSYRDRLAELVGELFFMRPV